MSIVRPLLERTILDYILGLGKFAEFRNDRVYSEHRSTFRVNYTLFQKGYYCLQITDLIVQHLDLG